MRLPLILAAMSSLTLGACNLTEEEIAALQLLNVESDVAAEDGVIETPSDPAITPPFILESSVVANPGPIVADTDHLDPDLVYAETEYWAFTDSALVPVDVNVRLVNRAFGEMALIVTHSDTGADMPRGSADDPNWRFLIRRDLMNNARAGAFSAADIGTYQLAGPAKGAGDRQDVAYAGELVRVHVTTPQSECGTLCAYVFESEGVYQVVRGAQSAKPVNVDFETGARHCADANQSLEWAGDIDGDNRVDLVFHDVSACAETFRLLLSSERGNGQIFGDAYGAVYDGDAGHATALCNNATA